MLWLTLSLAALSPSQAFPWMDSSSGSGFLSRVKRDDCAAVQTAHGECTTKWVSLIILYLIKKMSGDPFHISLIRAYADYQAEWAAGDWTLYQNNNQPQRDKQTRRQILQKDQNHFQETMVGRTGWLARPVTIWPDPLRWKRVQWIVLVICYLSPIKCLLFLRTAGTNWLSLAVSARKRFLHLFVVVDISDIAPMWCDTGGQDEGQPDGSEPAASQGQRPVLGFHQVSSCQVGSFSTWKVTRYVWLGFFVS